MLVALWCTWFVWRVGRWLGWRRKEEEREGGEKREGKKKKKGRGGAAPHRRLVTPLEGVRLLPPGGYSQAWGEGKERESWRWRWRCRWLRFVQRGGELSGEGQGKFALQVFGPCLSSESFSGCVGAWFSSVPWSAFLFCRRVVERVVVCVWSVSWGVKRFPVVCVLLAKLFGSVGELRLKVRYVGGVDNVLRK